MKTILLTGGAGYIGSHIAVELLEAGYEVVITDNLSNSNPTVIKRIEKISQRKPYFYRVDVANQKELEPVFKKHTIDSVIHLAGHKAVGESVHSPMKYYKNNLNTTLVLCDLMQRYRIYKIVFSSSATVYGIPEKLPITEEHGISPTNPYGHTKAMIEQILIDLSNSRAPWRVTILRYFNPIGAHPTGLIGEDPSGVPNNLLPYIAQVAGGRLEKLTIHGDNYPTPDGTGVRDYIHVVDLALGHLAAIRNPSRKNDIAIYNLGTGKGNSVLEAIRAFQEASSQNISYFIGPRRDGDVAECYADPSRAKAILGWTATKTLQDACRDSWNWQINNPRGYE